MKGLNSDYIIESGSLGLFRYSLAVYDAVLVIVSTCLYRSLPELLKKEVYIPDLHLRYADSGSKKEQTASLLSPSCVCYLWTLPIGMCSEDICMSLYVEHACIKYIHGVKYKNGVFF